jgi:hypothetical protein
MSLSKFRSARLELLVCVLGPIVVLAAIMIPGLTRCRTVKRQLADRQTWLDQIPRMERQLAETCGVLSPFAARSAEDDKAADLTLVVDEAASDHGFTTRSVNVDKQPGTESWTDYRITVSGMGPIRSIIAMLDFLEHPAQRFRVTSVTLKPKGFNGGAIYDGEMVLTYRSVIPPLGADPGAYGEPVTVAYAEQQMGRLRQLTEAMKAWMDERRAPLIAREVESPKNDATVANRPVVRLFALTGIVQDMKNPLALTDRGLFGVGDRVDDVLVLGANGRTETVKLYADDPR